MSLSTCLSSLVLLTFVGFSKEKLGIEIPSFEFVRVQERRTDHYDGVNGGERKIQRHYYGKSSHRF